MLAAQSKHSKPASSVVKDSPFSRLLEANTEAGGKVQYTLCSLTSDVYTHVVLSEQWFGTTQFIVKMLKLPTLCSRYFRNIPLWNSLPTIALQQSALLYFRRRLCVPLLCRLKIVFLFLTLRLLWAFFRHSFYLVSGQQCIKSASVVPHSLWT